MLTTSQGWLELMRSWLVGLVIGLVLAGCLSPSGSSNDPPPEGPPTSQGLAQQLAANLPQQLVTSPWNATGAVTWWENFVTAYPKRDVFLPNNALAAQHIADGLAKEGLQTRVLRYLVGPVPGSNQPVGIHVVEAIKQGTTLSDRALAIGAHYDTQAGTLQGAFDNGAGTAMVFELCKHLAKVPMNRTLLCLFFDAEEIGARGSAAYNATPPPDSPKIDFYFGYDMVGINWPGYPAWKIHNWIQAAYSPDFFPFVEATVRDVLGWPFDGAEVFPFNDRNSDEATFIRAGIPTVRFAGGRTAGAYDQYHLPNDSVAHVYDMVGGRANFELGFGALVQESYILALMLDQTNLDAIRSAAS
jgi:hypothetical protein